MAIAAIINAVCRHYSFSLPPPSFASFLLFFFLSSSLSLSGIFFLSFPEKGEWPDETERGE